MSAEMGVLRETWPGWRIEAGTGPGWRTEAVRLRRARGRSRVGASCPGVSHSREEAPGAGGYCIEAGWREGGEGYYREVGSHSDLY